MTLDSLRLFRKVFNKLRTLFLTKRGATMTCCNQIDLSVLDKVYN